MNNRFFWLVATMLCNLATFSYGAAETEFEQVLKPRMPAINAAYQDYVRSHRIFRNSPFAKKQTRYLKLFSESLIASRMEEYTEAHIAPLARKYSWAIPNDKALTTIAALGPLIEIGAGTGYWAMLLAGKGADIVAFDNNSWDGNEIYRRTALWFEVQDGDETVLNNYPQRSLILCWPPYAGESKSLAYRSLQLFKGDYLVYIGLDSGDQRFFDLLARNFKLVRRISLQNWPGYKDSVWIYQRKEQGQSTEATCCEVACSSCPLQ